jgi:hypothetical protein
MSRNTYIFIALLIISYPASSQVFTGINWVNWAQEPNYEGVTGYDENPYDSKRKHYDAVKLDPDQFMIETTETFDSLWVNLGDPEFINRPIFLNGGDPYDLENEATFGAMWKAAHDGSNLYVLLMYYDLNAFATPDSRSFSIFTQPTEIFRHEPTFQAGVQGNDMARKNMAYGRYVELGGGLVDFTGGYVADFYATHGTSGQWHSNIIGFESLMNANHFWHDYDNLIRAMLIMTFDGALAYPADPNDLEGEQVSLTEGSIIAFDIQSRAIKDPHWEFNYRSEYAWSADNFTVYASNYYAGHLQILPGELFTVTT